MKKSILIFCIIIANAAVQGQGYLPYYQKITEAEIYCCKNDFQNALQSYKKAFDLVEKPLSKDLYNATICASLLTQDSLMFLYMEYCLKTSVPIEKFTKNTIVFAKYFQDLKWQELSEKSSLYYQNYLSKLNNEYIAALNSIDERDQAARKKIKPYMLYLKKRSLRINKLFHNWHVTDSCNRIIIDSLIEQYGYPNSESVGIDKLALETNRFVCLWHYGDSSFVYNIQYSAMLNGYISPQHYAEKIEYVMPRRDTLCYGTIYNNNIYKYIYNANSGEMPQKSKELLNKNRAKIGMRTVEESIIILNFHKETGNKYNFLISPTLQ
jgi:hypothetical protein